jgi:1,4-dihydroxy-2-naphthoate polyprenyltransferase
MDTAMWIRALRVIPRINKTEWERLDVVAKWLVATRAAVIILTFMSAAIAGLLALMAGQFNLGRWVLLVIGLVFAHGANNLINDLTDFRRGVDENNYFRTLYGPQPMQQGLMTSRENMTYIIVTGIIAVAAGIPLVLFGGTTALALMLVGAFFVLFYTFPLKYIGMGEISLLTIWGPLMVGGGYFVITGQWNWFVVVASLPHALGVTTVLFGKHTDKLDMDRAKKIYTLPVIIGEKAARYAVLVMFVLMYLVVFYLIASGYFSLWMLVVVGALPFLRRPVVLFLKPRPTEKPADLPDGIWPLWFSAAAFVHARWFGFLFLVGLILSLIF